MVHWNKAALSLIAIWLVGCDTPVSETAAGASPPGAIWLLQSINQKPVEARTTLRFLANGSIAGDAPCNSYSASQKVPLPWFEAGPITVTKRTCEHQAEENRYIQSLDEMIFAEITGNTMLLTGENGEELLYRIE